MVNVVDLFCVVILSLKSDVLHKSGLKMYLMYLQKATELSGGCEKYLPLQSCPHKKVNIYSHFCLIIYFINCFVLKWRGVEVAKANPHCRLGSTAEKISHQDKPCVSKKVDRFSRYPDSLLPLLPETLAPVAKITLGSKTIPKDMQSESNCEEMAPTEAPLYQFHWHSLTNQVFFLLVVCSSGRFKPFICKKHWMFSSPR